MQFWLYCMYVCLDLQKRGYRNLFLYTLSLSLAMEHVFFFPQFLFIHLIGYRIGKCRQTLMSFSLSIDLLPPPPPPPLPKKKKRFSQLPIILSVCQFEISARIRLNSAFIVGCLRVFLAALSKVFWKASLSLMKEQFSRLAKTAASTIFWYFVSFRATRVKD